MPSETRAIGRGGLFSKVALLLSGSFLISAVGSFLGQGMTGLGTFIILAILFLAGAFIVPVMARKSPTVGIIALSVWTFVSGLFLGPTLAYYAKALGPQTVLLAYIGTAGVMAICGAIGALSGKDFSGMGKWLMFLLLGLIGVGIVNIFVHFSKGVDIIYSLIGMAVFAGFFIFDFFRASKAGNTWENAVNVTMQLYLDYINFLLYLLRLLKRLKD